MSANHFPQELADAVLALCRERGADKTICPTDAAKAFAEARGGDDLAWRDWLQPVRQVAVTLANQGQLVIYRKGKPVDPSDFCGVYRIGAPRGD